ncbi:MAG: phage holin family protein [Betaproteobacteria bacterium]
MTDQESAPPLRPPLRPALARLSDAALALLKTRGELAAAEFAEERERLKRSALTLAVALLMLAFALGGVGTWVVVYFWDSGRLTAIAVVTIVYALLAFALWRVDRARGESDPVPFAATLAEFDKDRAWLAQHAQPQPAAEPSEP